MQRPLFTLLALFAVGATPLAAQSVARPFTLGLSVGPTMVTGEDRDFYKLGYHLQGNVSVPLPAWSAAVRLEAMYHKLPGKHKSDQVVAGAPDTLFVNDLSVLAATVNAQLFTAPAASPVRPYVLVGTGPYRVESELEVYGQRRSGADTKLGVTGGAGLAFSLGATKAYAEIAVHNVFAEGGSARLYPLTIGFTF